MRALEVVIQMTILLHKLYLVKVCMKRRGGSKIPKNLPTWFMNDEYVLNLNLVEQEQQHGGFLIFNRLNRLLDLVLLCLDRLIGYSNSIT